MLDSQPHPVNPPAVESIIAGIPDSYIHHAEFFAPTRNVQALKESLAAGKSSPQAASRGSFSSGLRSPGGDSSQGDSNPPSSPASVVSMSSANVGTDNRFVLTPARSSHVDPQLYVQL